MTHILLAIAITAALLWFVWPDVKRWPYSKGRLIWREADARKRLPEHWVGE